MYFNANNELEELRADVERLTSELLAAKALHCSFCSKSQREVRKLIAGPDDVFICDECVELCKTIIVQETH
jgi:hypothetical protein